MKPWEETTEDNWTLEENTSGRLMLVGAIMSEDGWWSLAREAPAMWRLLAENEFQRRHGGVIYCMSCGGEAYEYDEDGEKLPSFEGLHHAGCEWLRIAKAIGYR